MSRHFDETLSEKLSRLGMTEAVYWKEYTKACRMWTSLREDPCGLIGRLDADRRLDLYGYTEEQRREIVTAEANSWMD